MDDQSGPGVPIDHSLAPQSLVHESSPHTKTISKPQPNAQAESSEELRLGPSGSNLLPEQELHPSLATFAPDIFAARAQPPSLLVFSGGTAFNGVVEDLKHFTTRVSHVLPVSDDGGSTAEIVRVLGGPAVGDIRSRCLRLSDESSEEALAVKRLLGHRLPVDAPGAKMEWYSIVEGEHELWTGVSDPYKDTIRAFLVHFHTQILRHSSERFSFQNGSIGNFFFAGARTFFRSMDAAIFTYSSISAIPKDSLVLPAVSTNDRLVLGAELRNGEIIRGQNMISHPSPAELEQSGVRNVNKALGACPPLPSPIKRVFYMSTEGTHLLQEVFPKVNPNVVKNLDQVDAIIYGMGSLYTSICPSLILRGVGEAIAAKDCPKVFLLNGTHDRETAGMAASDFVLAVCNALNRTHGEDRASRLYYLPPTYVTVFLVPEGGQIPVDIENLHSIGITRVVTVPSEVADNGSIVFNSTKLIETLGNVIASTPPALAD
ncbi:maternal effect embryo arrest 18 [Klebsormidium nitens]|uniref:Maternal effect embryo arrest 18 n=1 Tax=Klebsormidium nitens TaxID=105231 RepID=A0A1Y1IF74_KLENI|nr:maternal effect embryo arrest 18 [Klebsormidium nitens]|eukprot:GAQ87741.1 maternal effect embryo arrest 18 [Klebsormidium nitens]